MKNSVNYWVKMKKVYLWPCNETKPILFRFFAKKLGNPFPRPTTNTSRIFISQIECINLSIFLTFTWDEKTPNKRGYFHEVHSNIKLQLLLRKQNVKTLDQKLHSNFDVGIYFWPRGGRGPHLSEFFLSSSCFLFAPPKKSLSEVIFSFVWNFMSDKLPHALLLLHAYSFPMYYVADKRFFFFRII